MTMPLSTMSKGPVLVVYSRMCKCLKMQQLLFPSGSECQESKNILVQRLRLSLSCGCSQDDNLSLHLSESQTTWKNQLLGSVTWRLARDSSFSRHKTLRRVSALRDSANTREQFHSAFYDLVPEAHTTISDSLELSC